MAKNGNGDTLLLVLEATSYQMKIFRHIKFVSKVATCKSTRKLICLQSCNMQKHQEANFRTAEYTSVSVQQ